MKKRKLMTIIAVFAAFCMIPTALFAQNVTAYRIAAERGDADAQFNLGLCYYNGWGVSKNYVEAARWFRKSADQGYAKAQYNLGYCYYIGNGVAKNCVEAVRWFRKAARQGHANAQKLLKEAGLSW